MFGHVGACSVCPSTQNILRKLLPPGWSLLHWGHESSMALTQFCGRYRAVNNRLDTEKLTEGRCRVECFSRTQEEHHNQIWAVKEGFL